MTWLIGLVLYAAFCAVCILAANDCLGLKHYGRVGKQYVPLPNQWLTTGVMHYTSFFNGESAWPDDERIAPQEYFICIHLPVYGMRYAIAHDEERWSQDCIYIGGARGVRRYSIEVPQVAPGL